MSTRLRVLAAMLVFAALVALYAAWVVATLRMLYEHYSGDVVVCRTDWRYALNGCTVFRPWLAWTELTVATAVLVVVAVVLLRWTEYPLRAMARAVSGFGPNNLAQRLDAGTGTEATAALAGAVNAMLARVAEGYEAQRRFAASASHELRTPLATQRALVEVSLTEPLSAEQQALLGRQLLATNERNVTVIDGLLTLAEAEQGPVIASLVDLATLTQDVVTAASGAAERRGVTITSSLTSAPVRGERALLERMVANLVDNAVKYNVDGGRIHVEVRADPPTVRVDNTGQLVAPDTVDGLFEPFRRAIGDRLAGADGAGLGLTIVRSIVHAHGGRVAAAANQAGGLCVTVALPAAEAGTDGGAG